MRGIVSVALVAQQDLLAALRDQTEGRKRHTMHQPRGRGCAVERHPWERLDRAIWADDPRETRDKLLMTGLRPRRIVR